jgi:hypothetical protein
VSDIKIIQGNNGLFISMPSKKRKNGTFRDIAHPLNSETRKHIEERVIAKYREVVEDAGGQPPAEIRRLAGRVAPDGMEAEASDMPLDLSEGGEGSWP